MWWMLPDLLPPILHTASDQKLDGEKAWEQSYVNGALEKAPKLRLPGYLFIYRENLDARCLHLLKFRMCELLEKFWW